MDISQGNRIHKKINHNILYKELHPKAVKLIIDQRNDFVTQLLFQAQLIAHRYKADVVLSNHVNEALEKVNPSRRRSRLMKVVMVVGSSLFGAFTHGFINELYSGNTILIGAYIVIGFIGILLVLFTTKR